MTLFEWLPTNLNKLMIVSWIFNWKPHILRSEYGDKKEAVYIPCIQMLFVTSVRDPYSERCTQGACLPPFPLPPNTQGHRGEAKPWIRIWPPESYSPADFNTQQIWMVMSGGAYCSLYCNLTSFIFTPRGAFIFSPPPFTLLGVAQRRHVALSSAVRTAAEANAVYLCIV